MTDNWHPDFATVRFHGSLWVGAERYEQLRAAAKRVLEADMLGVRDLDALNALEDAAGFTQQGQSKRSGR